MTDPISIKWELGRDRYGRRVTMTREGTDYEIHIEPSDQRDDGERIRSLSSTLILAAARIIDPPDKDGLYAPHGPNCGCHYCT